MEPGEYARMHAVEERMWWYRGLHANLLGQLARHARPGAAILDAGCGTGGLLARLAGEAVGLDYAEVAARYARSKSGRRVVVGSINDLPFSQGAFAAVVSADVLAHRSVDEARALAELRRCLAPGGVVILNLPAYRWLASRHDRRVHQVRRYTRSRLARLLGSAGFRAIFTSYWNTILFPLMVLRRLLFSGGEAGDVRLMPAPVEALFRGAVVLESRLLARGVRLPFGGSVLAVGVKDG
ncbi:MAG: class I SAM-dependent methyltransferase [Alphaproteobacteria bacterium]|nr:class I SAM-dependent methyltransferase [Alphaproteobacteria bacterium]